MCKTKNVIEMATGVPFWRHFCIDSVKATSLMKRETGVVAEKEEMLLFWNKNLQLLNFELK